MRLVISCEVWEPKSRTSTTSRRGPTAATGAASPSAKAVPLSPSSCRLLPEASFAHPHRLAPLKDLALAGDRRRDHHFDALKLAKVGRAADTEGAAQRTSEVLGAIVHPRRPAEDLGQSGLDAYLDAGSPRQVGIRGGHAPVEATGGRLGRGRPRRPCQHRLRPPNRSPPPHPPR